MFLLRRKADGLYKRSNRFGPKWTPDKGTAKIFPTRGACRNAVDSERWIKCFTGSTVNRRGQMIDHFEWVEDTHFFEKFDVVPVRVTVEVL